MSNTTTLITMLVIALALFLGGWFRPQFKTPPALPPASSITQPAPAHLKVANTASPETVSTNPIATPEQTQESIENQIATLESFSRNDDAASLDHILLSLNDPDPEIRDTAVDAVIQFGSADAIPALQMAVAKAERPAEKMKLLEAIEFLALPPLAVNTATNQP